MVFPCQLQKCMHPNRVLGWVSQWNISQCDRTVAKGEVLLSHWQENKDGQVCQEFRDLYFIGFTPNGIVATDFGIRLLHFYCIFITINYLNDLNDSFSSHVISDVNRIYIAWLHSMWQTSKTLKNFLKFIFIWIFDSCILLPKFICLFLWSLMDGIQKLNSEGN